MSDLSRHINFTILYLVTQVLRCYPILDLIELFGAVGLNDCQYVVNSRLLHYTPRDDHKTITCAPHGTCIFGRR
jgi:hypothetical protein